MNHKQLKRTLRECRLSAEGNQPQLRARLREHTTTRIECTGPDTSPIHYDRDEDDTETPEETTKIIPNEKHNLALLLCLLPPLLLYQDHLSPPREPTTRARKRTIKDEATEQWDNEMRDRPWALHEFWDLAHTVHQFIAGFQPDFLAFSTEKNPPQLEELQSAVQFLAIEYRRCISQMESTMETLSLNYYQVTSKQRQMKTITDQMEQVTEQLVDVLLNPVEADTPEEAEYEDQNQPPTSEDCEDDTVMNELLTDLQSVIEREPSPPRKRRRR